jgi:hypothetical protein
VRNRPFVPEGTADIAFMLGDLCTVGRPVESIASGTTEVAITYTKTTDVPCAVQPTRDPVRGTEVETAYGRMTILSHLLFFLIDADVRVGDLVRVNTGPYEGDHMRLTFRAAYAESHIEMDAVLDQKHTEQDTLG